jgi:hypothetical protein
MSGKVVLCLYDSELTVSRVADTSPHHFWKLDPDPHYSEKLDQDQAGPASKSKFKKLYRLK